MVALPLCGGDGVTRALDIRCIQFRGIEPRGEIEWALTRLISYVN
jgi:hypothetical protein